MTSVEELRRLHVYKRTLPGMRICVIDGKHAAIATLARSTPLDHVLKAHEFCRKKNAEIRVT